MKNNLPLSTLGTLRNTKYFLSDSAVLSDLGVEKISNLGVFYKIANFPVLATVPLTVSL